MKGMKGYKLQWRQSVVYGPGLLSHGVMSTYCKNLGGVGKDHLIYILRAGKKGRGKRVAKARCFFLCSDQERAQRDMEREVGSAIRLTPLALDPPSAVDGSEEMFLGYYPDGDPVVSVGGQVKHDG